MKNSDICVSISEFEELELLLGSGDEEEARYSISSPKALELFRQDLCDRTYDITLERGAKTVNSLPLKQCVQSFNVFDFLKDTVHRVPDLGGTDAAAEDGSAAKRRKIRKDEEDCIDDETKRAGMRESTKSEKFEADPDFSQNDAKPREILEGPENFAGSAESRIAREEYADKSVRNFDLNIDLNENGDSTLISTGVPSEMKHEEMMVWSLDDVQLMGGDPAQFANLNGTMHEEEEDYDEE